MTATAPRRPRPISPFMIGPYYRPQLTSMLSIAFRFTGVALAGGALLLAWWLHALAGGPDGYALFAHFIDSIAGSVVVVAMIASLVYHFLNGLRHISWDIGLGLDIPNVYRSGWATLVLTVVLTAVICWFAFAGGAA